MDPDADVAEYQEFLKCSICLDILQDEKMLPCSHMFCFGCLRDYIKTAKAVTCPECRETHQVPPGGVRNFPKNVRLRQFLDKLCPACSKNPKKEKCFHCREVVCGACKNQHLAKVREEMVEKIAMVEAVDDSKIAKEVKREKKVLKDKEKLMERDMTRFAEEVMKIVRNRERKLKSDTKKTFKAEQEKLDQQLKIHQDKVNKIKVLPIPKKGDLAKLPDAKLKELKDNWPQWEKLLTDIKESTLSSSSAPQLEAGTSEIGIAIKRNWNILTDEDNSDSSSVNSEQDILSTPKISRTPTTNQPSCVITGYGLGRLKAPFRVAVSPVTNNLLVVDTENHRVQNFDVTGGYLTTFGMRGDRDGDFKHPIGVYITSEGQHFIADTKNHRIEVFDAQGRYIRSFGREGSGVGEFSQPWDITMDTHKLLYVSDCANNRIQVLMMDGRYIRSIGEHKLSNPTGIVVDKNGDVYVADCENHRIVVFSKTGQLKQTIGKEGQKQGELSYPDGLVLDHHGNIVVAEWGNHRVQVFDKRGKSLRILGTHGSGSGEFQEPRGVCLVDGKIVVADCGNNRIQIF